MPQGLCLLRRLALAVSCALVSGPALAELVIDGLDDELEENVRAYASIAGEACDAEPWRIRRRARSLEKETREALEPYGFYGPDVVVSTSHDDDCWQVILHVEPGDPVLLRNVDLSVSGPGNSHEQFDDLFRVSEIEPGAPLRHARYESLKRNLQIRAADRGFVEAAFSESRIEVWPDELAADISLNLDTGPRYRFGDVDIQQDFLDASLVSNYFNIETGAPFDNRQLLRAQRDLSESAYFGRVEVYPDVEQATDRRIPIRVRLEPGTRIEYTIGLGASTDTGPRFRAGLRNNRLNREGHRLTTDLGISPVLQGLASEYRIPLGDPRREWFSFTAGLSNEQTDTFDNESQQVGMRWTTALSDTWLQTLALDFNNESFDVGTDVQTTRTLVPAIVFDHKLADRDIFPMRGRRLGAELRGTDEMLGSTTSYLQVLGWFRWIRSFGSGNRVLFRINGGATVSGDFGNLPPSVRFFAGGDESVRGFDFDSLGPTDVNGDVVGGDNLLVASIEYERQLRGNFYGALFVDTGNAFDGTDLQAETGAGFGIKWRSPLGPIRLYVGFPVSDSTRNPRLHLRLGADL